MEIAAIIIATLGACGLGFVLGWTLYFANRGKSGNLSTSDLGAIAGVIAGGTVTAFLGNLVGTGVDKALVFGGYGIGLFLGFVTYYLLLRQATSEAEEPIALNSLARIQKMPRLASLSDVQMFVPLAATAPGHTDILAQLKAADQAIDALTQDLGKKVDDLVLAGHDAEADRIRKDIRKLDKLDREISARIASISLSGPEMRALLAILVIETNKLNAEAERMKKATTNIQKVSDLLGALNSLIETLEKLT